MIKVKNITSWLARTSSIRTAWCLLEKRERIILQLRYGITFHQPHTPEQMSRLLNVSNQRIKQLEMIALRKITSGDFTKVSARRFPRNTAPKVPTNE